MILGLEIGGAYLAGIVTALLVGFFAGRWWLRRKLRDVLGSGLLVGSVSGLATSSLPQTGTGLQPGDFIRRVSEEKIPKPPE